ncbi:hypothetical protein D3C76_943100 [compost metagenome]
MRLRALSAVTTSGDKVTFCGVPFLVISMRQTRASKSRSRQAIACTFERRAPVSIASRKKSLKLDSPMAANK